MYSCNSATGQCKLDPTGSLLPGECIATCKSPTPTQVAPAVAGGLVGCAALGASLWFYKNKFSKRNLSRNKHKYAVQLQEINEQGDAYVQMDSGGQLQ
jgi:hypothetical protein